MRLPAASANDAASIQLSKVAIELLAEMAEWVTGRVLAEFIDQIVDALSGYLQTEICGIYETAASCIYKLASRKRIKNDELPM